MTARPDRTDRPAPLAWLAAAAVGAALVGVADRHQRVRRVPPDLWGPTLYLPLSFTPASLPFLRAFVRARPAAHRPGVATRTALVPGTAGEPDVSVLLSERADRPLGSPALLWLHGGGFVSGAAGSSVDDAPRLAHEANVLVASVDYRLAPEHPFPAALDDAYAALRWLHDHATELGIDPARIAVGGDSAGGGLAACLAQLAADRGEVPVAFQSLLYPMLDDRTVLREAPPGVGELLWTPADNRFGWASYLGAEPGGDVPPHAVAARRVALGTLPPAWIGVGDRDLFHSEDVAYAERLREQGVPVTLDVIPGYYHGADRVAPHAPQTRTLLARQVGTLRRALGLAEGG
jgi:acetyl esterase/lipase